MKNKTALLLCTLLASSIIPSDLLANETITVNAPWQIDEAPSSGTAVINCTLKTNDCSPLQTQSKTLQLSGSAPFKGTQSFTFEGNEVDDKANVVCVLSTESDSIGDVKQLSGNNGNCNWKENNEPQGFFSNVTQTISSFFGGDDKPEECPPFDCPAGLTPIDTNGDGCMDECQEPRECRPIECSDDQIPTDSNDDGCLDMCKDKPKKKKLPPPNRAEIPTPKIPDITGNKPPQCEPFDCPAGLTPVDTNGDSCMDECQEPKQCEPFDCPAGLTPVDTNGDSCMDECQEPKQCEPFDCPAGQTPEDDNGDGCPDICKDGDS